MDRGYVALWRKSMDSRIFQNEGLWKVWTWCLMKATHKKRWVTLKTGKGDIEIKIHPGEFIFGRNSAAKELKMAPSTVRNRMMKLKKLLNLDIKEDSQYSIINIVNWDIYQVENNKKDNQKDNQRTIKGQSKDTNNNVNNVNKKEKTYKKEKYLDFVFLTKIEHEKLLKEFGIEKLKGWIERVNNYVGSKGKKYKSHYHTILAWDRNDKKSQGASTNGTKLPKVDYSDIRGRDD